MAMLEELGKLIERDIEDEEDAPVEQQSDDIDDEIEDEEDAASPSGELLNHIKNVKAAAAFVDKLTTDEATTTAFEAEVALRKAIFRMQDLAEEPNKSKK